MKHLLSLDKNVANTGKKRSVIALQRFIYERPLNNFLSLHLNTYIQNNDILRILEILIKESTANFLAHSSIRNSSIKVYHVLRIPVLKATTLKMAIKPCRFPDRYRLPSQLDERYVNNKAKRSKSSRNGSIPFSGIIFAILKILPIRAEYHWATESEKSRDARIIVGSKICKSDYRLRYERWVESDYVRIGGKQSLSLFRSIFSRIRRGCISSQRLGIFAITNSWRWKARVRSLSPSNVY